VVTGNGGGRRAAGPPPRGTGDKHHPNMTLGMGGPKVPDMIPGNHVRGRDRQTNRSEREKAGFETSWRDPGRGHRTPPL